MKKFNISKPRKYTDGQGNEKTAWDNIGEYLEFEKQDGTISRIIKIPAISLEANVFEQKPKEDRPKQEVREEHREVPADELPSVSIDNNEDIPW
jgi:hypothetical protein